MVGHRTTEHEALILGKITRRLAILVLLLSACSAVGWELQNYAFYGEVPQGNGRDLQRMSVAEWSYRIEDHDTLSSHQGEFQIDTTRIGGYRYWVMTRSSIDTLGRAVSDSALLDHYTLRTRESWHRGGDGEVTRMRFNKRVVNVERIDPNGRKHRFRMIHTAEPYSKIGIELVLATMKWRLGQKGSLPVVSNDGRSMEWLHYDAIDLISEPRQVAGGMVFESVWVVASKLNGIEGEYWINSKTHEVLRRSTAHKDGSKLLIAMGSTMPKLSGLAIEPLPTEAGPGTRVLHLNFPTSSGTGPGSDSNGASSGQSGP